MVATLSSPTLSFSRDGRRLLVADHDAVTITDTVSHATCRIAVEAPVGVAGFADQIWVAHGHSPELSRFGVNGARIAVAHALPGGGGELIAAAAAAPAALWTGHPPVVISEEQGSTRVANAPRGDVVVPLTSRRWIVANGSRVTVPSGLTCELGAGARVVAGAIVFDATAIGLVVERPSAREIAVVGIGNGRIQLRQAIVPGALRVATQCGWIGAKVESDRIAIVDLRRGRVIGEVAASVAIDDFALDPDGRRIAVRYVTRDVEVLDLRERMEAAREIRREVPAARPAEPVDAEPGEPTVAEAAAADDDRAVSPPPTIVATSARHACTLQRPLELAALQPIVHVPTIDRVAALQLVDREMRRVALRTLCAIADGWDTRRIGYGNEGAHPFEHEVAALVGMNAGFARDHVAAARAHLAAYEAEHARLTDARDPARPLGALALELGLSPLALDILLVVAAPLLWSEAARLFGILANDPGRPIVDEALVEQILRDHASRHDIAAELDVRAPLVRLGIIGIQASRPRPFAALTVDRVVIARLRREIPDLPAIEVRGSDRALEEIAVAPAVIERAAAELARCRGPARICVRGRDGSGRRTLLAAFAAEAGRALGIIDVAALPRDGRAAALRIALRRAQLAGLLPCIRGLAGVMHGEQAAREGIAEALAVHPGPVALVQSPGEEAPLDPGFVAIELPVLAEGERLALWQQALAETGLVAHAPDLAARYRVGPGTLHRAITAARRTDDADATAAIDAYLRQTRDARLGAHARRVDRLATWDQLVLPADIRDSLRELVSRVRHRRTVFEAWGMDRHVATSRGLTALFSGPPGTGKTLVAGVIARELGLELYQVELSKLMSKWIGETERNLAAIFDAADDGQVILLFDEADSLFAKRTEVRSSNDRYANLEVNYLLQRLDSFEGIAILTTNAATAIDPAFKRRMSFRLSFPFPDEDTREQLWRAHLPSTLPVAGPLALDRLAHKYQLSGGYIRNACLRAAFLAAQDESALAQAHLERAVALEFAELGKLSTGGSLD